MSLRNMLRETEVKVRKTFSTNKKKKIQDHFPVIEFVPIFIQKINCNKYKHSRCSVDINSTNALFENTTQVLGNADFVHINKYNKTTVADDRCNDLLTYFLQDGKVTPKNLCIAYTYFSPRNYLAYMNLDHVVQNPAFSITMSNRKTS